MKTILNKIEKYLLYVFTFSIPFQTRIFIGEWGTPKDEFTSGFLYLTDVFFLFLAFSWLLRGVKIKMRKYDLYLLGFLAIAILSVFQYKIITLGIYNAIKISEFIVFYFYLRESLSIFKKDRIIMIFIYSGVFQALLAVVQFFFQHDTGLKYLGETSLSPDLPGIAKIDTSNEKIMRPYGTFTHPNVLAAYLLFAIIFFYYTHIKKIQAKTWFDIFIFCILTSGLLLTFSRSVILVFFVFTLLLFIKNRNNVLVKKLAAISAIIFVIFFIFFSQEMIQRANLASDSQNLDARALYKGVASYMISQNPFFGVGVGNFVNEFRKLGIFQKDKDYLYQPVHDTYLLIASEIGILGFLIFLWFIFLLLKDIKKYQMEHSLKMIYFGSIFSLMMLFFTDHYFWDLEQGRFLMWFLLAYISSSEA